MKVKTEELNKRTPPFPLDLLGRPLPFSRCYAAPSSGGPEFCSLTSSPGPGGNHIRSRCTRDRLREASATGRSFSLWHGKETGPGIQAQGEREVVGAPRAPRQTIRAAIADDTGFSDTVWPCAPWERRRRLTEQKGKRRFAGTLDSWYQLTWAWRSGLREKKGGGRWKLYFSRIGGGLSKIWGIGVQMFRPKGGERRNPCSCRALLWEVHACNQTWGSSLHKPLEIEKLI